MRYPWTWALGLSKGTTCEGLIGHVWQVKDSSVSVSQHRVGKYHSAGNNGIYESLLCNSSGKHVWYPFAELPHALWWFHNNCKESDARKLIRVKDGGSGSMAGSFKLPSRDEFDHAMRLVLTRKQTKEVKGNPEKYKILPKASPFDYLDLHDRMFYERPIHKTSCRVSPDNQKDSLSGGSYTFLGTKPITSLRIYRRKACIIWSASRMGAAGAWPGALNFLYTSFPMGKGH